ncbi:helix-turn-helix domain-containing protein [Enterovibrio baiacu]|uniref:AraC family transcriptional regulator n=1 Tax=Enterovibrio baiacu TaxID=2491023 RepID=UPI003D13FE61
MQIPNVGFSYESTEQAEFEIIDMAKIYRSKGYDHDPAAPHRVSFFMMIFIEEGEGVHMVDFKEYPFKPGTMLFVQRDQVHAFDDTSQPKGKILIFTQAFLDNLHTNMRLPNYTPTHLNRQHSPFLQLEGESRERTHNLILQITQELDLNDRDPLIVMYLFSALALILKRQQPDEHCESLSQSQSATFSRFFTLLQSNFQRVRDANWYASQIGTTYKTLNQVCKLAAGLTAKQVIDNFTILEIKRRLVVSNITSQQIAFDFGFEDASNFVKYFKKETQLTPSQFQKLYVTPAL